MANIMIHYAAFSLHNSQSKVLVTDSFLDGFDTRTDSIQEI